MLNDETFTLKLFVREHGYQKGKAHLNVESFCQWVNNELLPSSYLAPNTPQSISVKTMASLSRFPEDRSQKGAHVDGRKRGNVMAH